jgi:hypothetical protein
MKTEQEIRDKLEEYKKENFLFETPTEIIYQRGTLSGIKALEWVLNEQKEQTK